LKVPVLSSPFSANQYIKRANIGQTHPNPVAEYRKLKPQINQTGCQPVTRYTQYAQAIRLLYQIFRENSALKFHRQTSGTHRVGNGGLGGLIRDHGLGGFPFATWPINRW
jgi:hypothetical protein